MPKKHPPVSLIIPTKDSAKTIGNCLESIRKQTYRNLEVIVVDGHSRDETAIIAKKHMCRVIKCDAQRTRARNIGAENAYGDFLLHLDSDMALGPDVIKDCLAKINEGYDSVVVPEVSVGEGFWAKCKALERSCYVGDETIEAARFHRKSVFREVGGYDPELIAGEDWDLHLRIKKAGFRIGRIDSLIKHYEGRLSLKQTMLKKYFYGYTIRRYIKKHPDESRIQFRLIRPAFLRNWRKLIRNPTCAIGVIIMKTCEGIAFKMGYETSISVND